MPRPDPRISVNKLGEYLTCSASRRRRILEDAKDPKSFIVPRFNDFYAIATQYLVSNPLNDGIITAAIEKIQSRQPCTDWEEHNKMLNVDLLGNLMDIPDLLPLNGLTMTALPLSQDDLTIAGVAVSVRPEIPIRGSDRGRDVIGALKLHVPKSFSLDDETADYVATTVQQHLATYPPCGGDIDYRLCFVADVPSRAVFAAPRSFTRRRKDIEAACEEIAARWPSL